jgi:hypothetical protein
VRVKTSEGVLEGELRGADEREIEIAQDEGPHRVAVADVVSAKTVVDWDAELRGSNR